MGKISVKVVPASSRDAIVSWLDESLKVTVKASPEQGKANAAVINLLATKLKTERDAIEIISGHSSPLKVLSIHGLEDSQIADLLKGMST